MTKPMRVANVTATTRTADKPSMTIGARSSAAYVALYVIVNHTLEYTYINSRNITGYFG